MDDKEWQKKQDAHNQEVAARQSGRNDSGTMAGAKGVDQYKANNPTHNQANAGPGTNTCFSACTQVLTPRGWHSIADLASGDSVISIDPDGISHVRRVLIAKRHLPASLTTVHAGDYSWVMTS